MSHTIFQCAVKDQFLLGVDLLCQIGIFVCACVIVADCFWWKTLIVNRIFIVFFFLFYLLMFSGVGNFTINLVIAKLRIRNFQILTEWERDLDDDKILTMVEVST